MSFLSWYQFPFIFHFDLLKSLFDIPVFVIGPWGYHYDSITWYEPCFCFKKRRNQLALQILIKVIHLVLSYDVCIFDNL